MSYASVAATNAPPPSEQPHADPALLNTTPPTHTNIVDDSSKLNIVGPDFKDDPHTYTSEADITVDDDDDIPVPSNSITHKKRTKSKKRLQEVEAEGAYIWETAKHYLFRPGVAGGLIGLLNVGLLAGTGRAFYLQPRLRRDTTAITSAIAATFALFSIEGYAAEKYRKTPRGQAEERRAREEGAIVYRHIREQVLRPGVLGGLVGIVNTAILGTVGYFSYVNWDKPTWDRRTVSAVTIGLLGLWTGEGYLTERYRKDRF
ncbi:hypothetical protein BDQ12DRAFT_730653 [Crucibulum laeve]|uniref:Uncharacterized protein n=1 Tax=Crucibulum laeve TaxID=68775 RepID=A0A5C3ML02_9AGAR|nr:hypothetical protein BDQ12DRAFT_730653 [Crucibulum laeve]